MAEIIKKCERKLFEKISSGEKRFDVRLGDIKVDKGDILILKESINGDLTGREIRKKVSFVLKTKELNYWADEDINKFGLIIIQLE